MLLHPDTVFKGQYELLVTMLRYEILYGMI